MTPRASLLLAAVSCLMLLSILGTSVEPTEDLRLLSFDIEPDHVVFDSSERTATVTILARIYSENGLIENESLGFMTYARFLGPRPLLPFVFSRNDTKLELKPTKIGDKRNRTYIKEWTFNNKIEQGVWKLESIKLVDKSGSVTTLSGADLKGIQDSFFVNIDYARWVVILLIYPAIFFIILLILYQKKPIPWIYRGYDGATSTSKVQFFVWTIAALYAYLVIILDAYFNHGVTEMAPAVPQNLILAMGLSAITTLAAKEVTSSYSEKGHVRKDGEIKGGIFLNDDGYPDLSKIQLMAWTFIGIGIFILKVLNSVLESSNIPSSLPDIDATLLALMGIGQGAYVGKKIATKEEKESIPRIYDISPKEGGADTDIVITGINFGDDPNNSEIKIDDKSIGRESWDKPPRWGLGEVKFLIGDIKPGAIADDLKTADIFKPEKMEIKIKVSVRGKDSNSKSFKIDSSSPWLNSINPDTGSINDNITLKGIHFGLIDQSTQSMIKIGDTTKSLAAEKWKDGEVTFRTSDILGSSAPSGEKMISVRVSGKDSNKLKFVLK